MRIKGLSILLAIILGYGIQGIVYPQVQGVANFSISARVSTHPTTYSTSSGGVSMQLEMTSPVVCDLDCDSVLEVVAAGYDGSGTSYVYVWNRSGSVRGGWPVSVSGRIDETPAVGDLDGDGVLEVVVSVGESVYTYNDDGTLVSGYPVSYGYTLGSPVVGDCGGDFSEEAVVRTEGSYVALSDIDLDGKKEIVVADISGISVEEYDGTVLYSWDIESDNITNVVLADVNSDNIPEVFLGIDNYIYGWEITGDILTGFPIDTGEAIVGGIDSLILADLDNDNLPEIVSGSVNGWILVCNLEGDTVFRTTIGDTENIIYQPVVADIDNDAGMEILAGSNNGYLYCWDSSGGLEDGWPVDTGYDLTKGLVLCDIEQDSSGNSIDPIGDMELLYSRKNGGIYVMELDTNFVPTSIQWGMYGFNNRGTSEWVSDYLMTGWSVFDDEPSGAEINSIYDWNKGGRAIELIGDGLNNGYALMDQDGSYLNTNNTQLQWSMLYSEDFVIYANVDTLNGRRDLYYTPAELGDINDGRWHTFNRSLVQDLKDAEPDNEILDINAFYIQGSGRIDDVMFLSGQPTGELTNYALNADVSVSSGSETKDNINDGDTDTIWISDPEDRPWVNYTWDEALEGVTKITIDNINRASSGWIYIYHSDGTVEELEFNIDSESIEIVFEEDIEDVTGVTIVFDTGGGSVSVGEIGVYYEEEEETTGEVYPAEVYIQIRNGYLWDPTMNNGTGGYWIPHGVAYQTWHEAFGQWQSPGQLRQDLDMMAAIGANAIRVDFVWRHIEEEDDIFSWGNYDMLLEEAKARGLRVFVVFGYQWSPDWALDVLSYEDEDGQDEFSEFLEAVCSRYSVGGEREDLAGTVLGWILGSGYGYLEMESMEYIGYDEASQEAFREWLEERYDGDISGLNDRWVNDNVTTPGYLLGYPYSDFSEVDMPTSFGRDKASWYDLIQWREKSIADFIARAAQAVRTVDPSHLISYAAVGMQLGEEDWEYNDEDANKIIKACSDIGAPLDFWSINNYPWGKENDELMTGKWGIERARHDTGLPVMVLETGFTSTETIYPGIDEERQGYLVRNAVWEALESGAIGVFVFHWNDRDPDYVTERKVGFGLVDMDRNPKQAYYTVEEAFQKMEGIGINGLFPQFNESTKDIAFLWDDAVDSILSRYMAEMHQLFGALKRLGFNPTFINSEEILNGDYLNYKAIVLPRNQKMFGDVLRLFPRIILDGIKIHVNSDLPGIMDEYGGSRNTDSEWLFMLQDLFGIDTTLSNLGIDPNLEDSDYSYGYYETSSFTLAYEPKQLYFPILGYDATIGMWKYRDEVMAGRGTVLARFDGESGNPAIIVNDYISGDTYDTAISLFSLGDGDAANWTWEDRYNWLALIYKDSEYGFGLTPDIQITGSSLVLVDYRKTLDESSVLLSFKNYSPDTSEGVSVTSSILLGKVVEDLINDIIIEDPCDGTVEQSIEPDGHNLLLAYESTSSPDTSAASSSSTSSDETDTTTTASDSTSSSSETSGSTSESTNSSTSDSSSDSSDTAGNTSESEDTSSDYNYYGYSVVVLGSGAGTTTTQTGGSSTSTQAQGETETSYPVHYRSYSGKDSGEEVFESNLKGEPTEEASPIEQFAQAITEEELEMPGIIRAVSKETREEYIKEIRSPQPEIPIWAKKIYEWIINLMSKFKRKMVSDTIFLILARR